jgi:hypothetical protein
MLVERKDPDTRENSNGSGSQVNESSGSLWPEGETPKASGNERRKHPLKGMGGIPVLQGNTAPLSFSQQRLWFFHRMNPQSPMYHMPIGFRLQGELDVHALEKSLRAVLLEHDIFRTNYRMRDDDQLIQIVDDSRIQAGLRRSNLKTSRMSSLFDHSTLHVISCSGPRSPGFTPVITS